jgi:hypothetical protein
MIKETLKDKTIAPQEIVESKIANLLILSKSMGLIDKDYLLRYTCPKT